MTAEAGTRSTPGGIVPAMARTGVLALAAAALLAVASCGGKIPATHYYVLPLTAPSPTVSHSGNLLLVKEFRPALALRRDQIMYRRGANEVAYYQYHRWAEDPAASISKFVAGGARAKGWFSAVGSYEGTPQTGYLLEGTVDRLEEMDTPQGVTAEVALSASLSDGQTGKLLWQGSATGSAKVEGTEVSELVSALTQAAETASNRLLDSLGQAVPSLPAPELPVRR